MPVTMQQFRERLKERIGLVKKAAAFALYAEVGNRTPRDTGRAAASWMLGVNRVDTEVRPPGHYPQVPAPPDIGEIRSGDVIHLSNNLPYIVPLNEGHSRQAPAGFVEAAVQRTIIGFPGVVAEVVRADGGL